MATKTKGKATPRGSFFRRLGRVQHPSTRTEESLLWRTIERAYLDGRLVTERTYQTQEIMAIAGCSSWPFLFEIQLLLAEHRSPLKLREVRGGYRVEAR